VYLNIFVKSSYTEGQMLKGLRSLGFAAALLVLSLAVGMVSAQDSMKTLVTTVSMVGGDIPTIDPTISETSSSIEVVNQIFMGLTMQEETTGAPELGLAESYTVSEDGLTFTFKLLPNVYWVRYNAETDAVEQLLDDSGNPRTVTAQDVVNGIERALNPETAAPYSYVLAAFIAGAVEYNAGEAEWDAVGVSLVDDLTVAITAPDAVSFAPSIYGLWVARPVPSWLIEEFGDSWTEAENIATNGPYALKEWNHEQDITIVKNPFWAGTEAIGQAKVDLVTYRFLDPDAAFAEYLAGTVDAITVPIAELERVKSDPELSLEYKTGTNPCTYYLGFDNTEEPLTNVHLRRALSYAIDRQSIVDNVTKGGQIPAQWFSRPGLNAAPTLESHPDLGIKFDAAKAQEELALALADLGLASAADLQLTLSYGDRADHKAIMEAIQAMWKETLGIEVTLDPRESSTYFATVSEDAPMIYRSGWCQDYADANNFLYDVFYSESSQNDPGYVSEAYDALIEEARLETDQAKRLELYAQAEQQFIVEDAGISPIYWYTTNQLIKPYVEPSVSVTGNQAYYNWDVTR
jgi:oligopeptide transport system substrate-binding protein